MRIGICLTNDSIVTEKLVKSKFMKLFLLKYILYIRWGNVQQKYQIFLLRGLIIKKPKQLFAGNLLLIMISIKRFYRLLHLLAFIPCSFFQLAIVPKFMALQKMRRNLS